MTSTRNALDPATETLIYGSRLRDGMVVRRETGYHSEYLSGRVQVADEFCTVTKLEDRPWDRRTIKRFIAVFPDGQMETAEGADSYTWIVRRDSLPEDDPEYLPATADRICQDILTQLGRLEKLLLRSRKS